MAQVGSGGARIAYDDAGNGSPAFVFVHGWACDRSTWAPQFADLSRDQRCLAVDLRGRGESPAVPPYDIATAAEDVAAVIESAGTGPAIVAGHSLGGLVGLVLNERHPGLVLGIVMGDTPLRRGIRADFEALVEGVRGAGSMEPARPLVERFFVEATPEAVRDQVRSTMLSAPADVAAGMLADSGLDDERLERFVRAADEKPFMAIWAARPLGDVAWLREITVFLRHEPIAESGHFFQLEKPAVTNALLRAFLDDVERDPRLAARATN